LVAVYRCKRGTARIRPNFPGHIYAIDEMFWLDCEINARGWPRMGARSGALGRLLTKNRGMSCGRCTMPRCRQLSFAGCAG
jgi:hypothetical protein